MPTSPAHGMALGSGVSFDSFTSFDRYIQDSVIGNGAYGTVYLAKNKVSRKNVAMKKLRVPVDEGMPMSTLREISMLSYVDRFEHPNVIRLLDVCHGSPTDIGKEKHLWMYLIFEHVEQDLATYFSKLPPGGMPESKIKNLSHQILCGIDFLHSLRILHRDLKPQNLLITDGGVIKLADFGLAKAYNFEMRLTTVVVTLWYRSPEVLLGNDYATPVDIWSIGCIMAEMFKGDPLFCGSSEGDQLGKIFRVIGSPAESEWPSSAISWDSFPFHQPVPLARIMPRLTQPANDLLSNLLCFDPVKRMSAYQALSHPYFNNSGYQVPNVLSQ